MPQPFTEEVERDEQCNKESRDSTHSAECVNVAGFLNPGVRIESEEEAKARYE
jgi:hypothetical protein